MPSIFTQSIEVIEIAEHRLQLDMASQIQRELKHSDLRVDWHFILWCITKSGTQEWSQNNYHGFPKAFVRVALLCASFCCTLCHWISSKWYRLCTILRISSKLRSATRIPGLITSGKIQTVVRLMWFARGVGQVRYFWRLLGCDQFNQHCWNCDGFLRSLKLIEDKFYVIVNEFWQVAWDMHILGPALSNERVSYDRQKHACQRIVHMCAREKHVPQSENCAS